MSSSPKTDITTDIGERLSGVRIDGVLYPWNGDEGRSSISCWRAFSPGVKTRDDSGIEKSSSSCPLERSTEGAEAGPPEFLLLAVTSGKLRSMISRCDNGVLLPERADEICERISASMTLWRERPDCGLPMVLGNTSRRCCELLADLADFATSGGFPGGSTSSGGLFLTSRTFSSGGSASGYLQNGDELCELVLIVRCDIVVL